jgi:flagellar hook-associated protein 3 FlgL
MRVTTGMIFDSGLSQIQRRTAACSTPSNRSPPAGASSALRRPGRLGAGPRGVPVEERQRLYAANQGYANDALRVVDSKLDAANELVTYVRTRAVESGNGAYSNPSGRPSRPTSPSSSPPCSPSPTARTPPATTSSAAIAATPSPSSAAWPPASYQGDQGPHAADLLVAQPADHQLRRRDLQPHPGAHRIGLCPVRSRQHRYGPGVGASLSGYNGHTYAINVGAGPTYQVFDSTTDPTHASPIAPTVTTSGSDTTLSFGGVSMTSPARRRRVTAIPCPGGQHLRRDGQLRQALNSGNDKVNRFAVTQTIAGMDASQESINQVRSGVGSRMVEVETQQNINGDLDLQYAETLSRLQDADYAEAVSNLTQQQTYLQAAQQSFMRVSNLSLFNYLGS